MIMQVKAGDLVRLRDGRTVYVTDAADPDPDAYRVYSIDAYTEDGSLVVKGELPVETIFVGQLYDPKPRGWSKGEPVTVVSDMSEVVSIIE
jgi:hypothetical protein